MHALLRALLALLTRPRPGRCACGAPGLCCYDDGRLLCAECALAAERARHPGQPEIISAAERR